MKKFSRDVTSTRSPRNAQFGIDCFAFNRALKSFVVRCFFFLRMMKT